jgi:hypothetical protein
MNINATACWFESTDCKHALLVINSKNKLGLSSVEKMLRSVQSNGIFVSPSEGSQTEFMSQKAVEVIDTLLEDNWTRILVGADNRCGLIGQVIIIYDKRSQLTPIEKKMMSYWTVLIINDGKPMPENALSRQNIRMISETI